MQVIHLEVIANGEYQEMPNDAVKAPVPLSRCSVILNTV